MTACAHCIGCVLLQILVTAETRKQPEGFKGVYKELNRIIAAAESDPRKFSGFEKHWHPQKVGPASVLQRLCAVSRVLMLTSIPPDT